MMTLRNAPLANDGVIILLKTARLLRRIFRPEDKCSPPTLVFPSSELTPRVFRRRNSVHRTRDVETTGANNVKKVSHTPHSPQHFN